MQMQMQMQMEMQRRGSENREREREQDIILGRKISLFIVLVICAVTMFMSYLEGDAGAGAGAGTGADMLIKIVMSVYEYMLSYIHFSQKVICDMVSFIVGLVFMLLFSLTTIAIIILLGIPFLALIFTFTNI